MLNEKSIPSVVRLPASPQPIASRAAINVADWSSSLALGDVLIKGRACRKRLRAARADATARRTGTAAARVRAARYWRSPLVIAAPRRRYRHRRAGATLPRRGRMARHAVAPRCDGAAAGRTSAGHVRTSIVVATRTQPEHGRAR